MARKPIQHNIEDKVFTTLINRYTRARKMDIVTMILTVYYQVLVDREIETRQKMERAQAELDRINQEGDEDDVDDVSEAEHQV
jgi:hypothetical protein